MKISTKKEQAKFAPVTLSFTAETPEELTLFVALAEQCHTGPAGLNKYANEYSSRSGLTPYTAVDSDAAHGTLMALRDQLRAVGITGRGFGK